MNKSGKVDLLQQTRRDSYRNEIDTLIAQAKRAASELLKLGQEDADRFVHALARAGEAEHLSLARLTVEETDMGVIQRDPLQCIFEIAESIGLIAVITPATNSTFTIIFRYIIKAAKAVYEVVLRDSKLYVFVVTMRKDEIAAHA